MKLNRTPPARKTVEQALRELEAPSQGLLGMLQSVTGRLRLAIDPIPSTADARLRLETARNHKTVRAILEGKTKNASTIDGTLRAMRTVYEGAKKEWQTAFVQAQEARRDLGVISEDTIHDLRATANLLQWYQNFFAQFSQQRRVPPPAPGPQPGPVPPPAPPRPVVPVPRPPVPVPPTPPQPAPRPTPTPPQEKTPEQEENEGRLRELEEELARQKAENDAQNQAMDPLLEQLQKLMGDMGQNAGANDHQKPDDEGFPPQHRNKFSPSMDKTKSGKEAKEKGTPPYFTVEPPLQGYYLQGLFDRFNTTTMEWEEKTNPRVACPQLSVPHSHTINGKINGLIVLPLPTGYTIDLSSLQSTTPITVTMDPDRGIIYMESALPQEFSVAFGKRPGGKLTNGGPARYHSEEIINGQLSGDTESFLTSIASLPQSERAIKIAEYVQETLEYSNDESYNFIYKADPKTYFQKIEEHKKADCDVANGYFVALCRRAGIPARLAVGHRVDGSKAGKGEITSGTGHAWSEIWDSTAWKTIDATPSGEQDNKDGDPLDTGNPEEKTDLQTNPRPKPNAKNKEQEMQDAIEEAKAKNEQGQMQQSDMDALQQQKDELAQAQIKQIAERVKAQEKILEAEAQRLEQKGKTTEAQALREKGEALKQAREAWEQDAQNNDKQDALKNAIRESAEKAADVERRELAILKTRMLKMRAARMAAEKKPS